MVISEARDDVVVAVVKPNSRLPLRTWRFAGRTHVSGGLGRRIGPCRSVGGAPNVMIDGLGLTPLSALPVVVIRTPPHARIFVAGAVWGEIGRTDALDFSNSGCGDWVIANVQGQMRLTLAGAGGARTGQAGSAELSSDGTGAISTRRVAGGVLAISTGPGPIELAEVLGPFNVRVAGPGSVVAAAGNVTDMQATVAGSGGVTLLGVARTLKASIIGSGDVQVTRVTGRVTRTVIGKGAVRIGP